MFKPSIPKLALSCALLAGLARPVVAAEHETVSMLPAQAELALMLDVARLRADYPALLEKGKVAAFVRALAESGGPDLREEGIETAALAFAPETTGSGAGLVALGRAENPPEALMRRLADHMAATQGATVEEEMHHGVRLLLLEKGGRRPVALADLASGDSLASFDGDGAHALVRLAVDSLAGSNPSYLESRRPRWGELTDVFTYANVTSLPLATVRAQLARLGLGDLPGVEELQLHLFEDPEFSNGATLSFACDSAIAAEAMATRLQAALARLIGAMPADDPWREVLAEAETGVVGKRAYAQVASIPEELVEVLLLHLIGAEGIRF